MRESCALIALLLFGAGRLKPVWMDEAAVRAHLEREYAPD